MTTYDDPHLTSASIPLPPKPVDVDRAEAAIRELLIALGQEDKAEVMANTPRRVAELYLETINPPYVDIEADFKLFPNPQTDRLLTEVVTVSDVQYVSMCEHHLAPAFGVAHVAYIPGEYVVGYSKLKKGLNYLARQPTLNERLLVDTLNFIEGRLQPRGMAVALQSVHCCIALRTNAPAQEVVTVEGFRGEMAKDPYRREFQAKVHARKPLFLGQ